MLPLNGHLQAQERGGDPKPPGERQSTLKQVRWVVMGRGTGYWERQDLVERDIVAAPCSTGGYSE